MSAEETGNYGNNAKGTKNKEAHILKEKTKECLEKKRVRGQDEEGRKAR